MDSLVLAITTVLALAAFGLFALSTGTDSRDFLPDDHAR